MNTSDTLYGMLAMFVGVLIALVTIGVGRHLGTLQANPAQASPAAVSLSPTALGNDLYRVCDGTTAIYYRDGAMAAVASGCAK